jgi:hypothetical protein
MRLVYHKHIIRATQTTTSTDILLSFRTNKPAETEDNPPENDAASIVHHILKSGNDYLIANALGDENQHSFSLLHPAPPL